MSYFFPGEGISNANFANKRWDSNAKSTVGHHQLRQWHLFINVVGNINLKFSSIYIYISVYIYIIMYSNIIIRHIHQKSKVFLAVIYIYIHTCYYVCIYIYIDTYIYIYIYIHTILYITSPWPLRSFMICISHCGTFKKAAGRQDDGDGILHEPPRQPAPLQDP